MNNELHPYFLMEKFGYPQRNGPKTDETIFDLQTTSSTRSEQLQTIQQEALELFKFPKTLGNFEGQEVIVAQGRFGPYVKLDKMFVSIPKGENISEVDLSRAIELIKEKQAADAPIDEYENLPVQKGVGRFGPFIKWNNMFINVNKKYDFDNLSHEDIVQLIEDKKQKEIDKLTIELKKADGKLANQSFIEKAPESVIIQEKERQKKFSEDLLKFKEQLSRLDS